MVERFTVGRADGLDPSVPLADVRFGFRQGYVLEIVRTTTTEAGAAAAESISTFVFPLAPTRYNLSEPFAANLTATDEDSIVPEEYGQLIRDVTVEGTFGLKKRRASGFGGAQGNGQAISGNEHFINLRQFFRTYGLLKQRPEDAHTYQMRWHALREDDHFIVIPQTFETPREARMNRVHYVYRFTLKAIGQVEDVTAPSVSQDTGNFFADAGRAIQSALNDANAALTELNSYAQQVRRATGGNLQALLINVTGLVSSVSNALSSGAESINYPFQLAVTLTNQIATASDDLADGVADITALDPDAIAARTSMQLEQALNRILAFPDRFVPTQNRRVEAAYEGARRLTNRDINDGTAGATEGTRTRVAFGSEADAVSPISRSRAVRSETVTGTTTLAGLAARFHVSPETIALINDLRPPYFAPGGGPGLLGPGDAVLIPLTSEEAGNDSLGTGTSDYATAEELLYGRDLAIDMDLFQRTGEFDLIEDLVHGGTDAQLVSGIPNVVQGVLITVETERGATIYIPDLGIMRSVGTKGTLNHVLLASINIREAMLADPRIEAIEESRVVLTDDVLEQEITPRLIGGRKDVTFIRPFGRASGGA